MPKNIVWVCTDQQRGDSLGCTGNPYAETPVLDALAAEGALLTRVISSHPVCMPSRASMHTGTLPLRHGVVCNGITLPRREAGDHERASHAATLADHLLEQGYHTRCIGKLHLQAHQPGIEHGLRESYAMWASGTNDDWTGPLYGFEHLEMSEGHGAQPGGAFLPWLKAKDPAAAARLLDTSTWPERPCSMGQVRASPIPTRCSATHWVAERAEAFIESDAATERPFFCWLGIPDPHHAWQPPAEVAERFADRDFLQPATGPKRNAVACWRTCEGMGDALANYTDAAACLAAVRRYTDAQNAVIDEAVGRVVDALKRRGLWEDTVFFFGSDHGEFLGDFGRVQKVDASCRSLSHVPGVMWDPSGGVSGRVDNVCGGVDVGPTLCRSAGVPWDVADGRALQDGGTGRALVQCVGNGTGKVRANYSWWTEHERLTWHPETDELEYYDHREDPDELVNTAGDHGDRCAELKSVLLAACLGSVARGVGRVSMW
ncbi:MAG: sulfatase-like hydrolase/transferase [Planctomycetota bacterium]